MRKHHEHYDGLLQRPFLAEHWHQGLMAAFALWLPVLVVVSAIGTDSIPVAVGIASALSAAVFAAVVTHYEGFTLELPTQRYRRYTWVAGLRFGTWHSLPAIAGVKVRYVEKRHTLPLTQEPVSVGLTATERGWQVLLQVDQSAVGIIAAQTGKEKAEQIATTLATLLHTGLTVAH
jgi:hypothetical protein